jgi:hypothetical protein
MPVDVPSDLVVVVHSENWLGKQALDECGDGLGRALTTIPVRRARATRAM